VSASAHLRRTPQVVSWHAAKRLIRSTRRESGQRSSNTARSPRLLGHTKDDRTSPATRQYTPACRADSRAPRWIHPSPMPVTTTRDWPHQCLCRREKRGESIDGTYRSSGGAKNCASVLARLALADLRVRSSRRHICMTPMRTTYSSRLRQSSAPPCGSSAPQGFGEFFGHVLGNQHCRVRGWPQPPEMASSAETAGRAPMHTRRVTDAALTLAAALQRSKVACESFLGLRRGGETRSARGPHGQRALAIKSWPMRPADSGPR